MNLKRLMNKKIKDEFQKTPYKENDNIEVWTGAKFGIVIYRTMNDDYVLYVYNTVFYDKKRDTILYGVVKSIDHKIFQHTYLRYSDNEKDCVEYCEQNGIDIVGTEFIYASFGNGFTTKEGAFQIIKGKTNAQYINASWKLL